MKDKLYSILEGAEENKDSNIYDAVMMVAIILSILPLAFKRSYAFFEYADIVITVLFILDYLARWSIADLKLKRGAVSFLIYPITPWAIIDLLSILPGFSVLASGFKLFRLLRLMRTFRLLRVFKLIRHSKNIRILKSVIANTKESLLMVGALALGYIVVSALIVFNVEPDSFDTFFDALYWATVSLTTVGYGDIYPVSDIGRIVTMISSILGIAIVALPAGIITAGYMEAINEAKNDTK